MSIDSFSTRRRERSERAECDRRVDHLANLPWPFPEELEEFSYSVNVEPARIPRPTRAAEWGRHLVDHGGVEYPAIMAERRRILDADPTRVRVRPGMELACWDLLLYYLRDLGHAYPADMRLTEYGDGRFHWRNDLLGTDQGFVLGDPATLPWGPMEFLAREVPDDLLLVTERDGHLYFDAGVVTFAAAWSVSFDVGTNVPALRVHGKSSSVTARARFGSGPDGIMLDQIESISLFDPASASALAMRE